MYSVKDRITRNVHEHEVLLSFNSDTMARVFRRWLDAQCDCSLAMTLVNAANSGCIYITKEERAALELYLPSGEGE
jgi:hypothetical protein